MVLVNTKLYNGYGILMLLVTLFLPDITLFEGFPTFQSIDFLLPLGAIALFLRRKELVFNWYYFLLGLFIIYIPFTMFINGNMGVTNQYFEIYKLLKFGFLIVYFSLITIADISPWVKPTFVVLSVLNLIHFFDLFHFNEILQYQYAGDKNIEFFGKNTLGMPTSKRMVGLMSNPNNNALLFLFFVIHFIKEKMNKWDWLWLAFSLLMTFLCQSKTAMFAMGGILFMTFLIQLFRCNVKTLISIVLIGFCFVIALAMSTNFFEHSAYVSALVDGRAMESGSVMGRLETWQYLGEMIIQKPIFGYGPDKNYFYENQLYSENEYVLYTWRYGLVGLLFFLGIISGPFFVVRKKLNEIPHKKLVLFISLMLIGALANNPFTEKHLMVLFAFVIGITFCHFNSLKKAIHE